MFLLNFLFLVEVISFCGLEIKQTNTTNTTNTTDHYIPSGFFQNTRANKCIGSRMHIRDDSLSMEHLSINNQFHL